MASPERRQEQLPAEVLGLGLVVREVGVDELLGVGQEEVLGHGGGARGAHRVHQPPVALQLHRAPVVQPAAGRGETRTWGCSTMSVNDVSQSSATLKGSLLMSHKILETLGSPQAANFFRIT